MYSVAGYGRMVADRIRFDAYREALARTIKPGAAVLEIGSGAGVFAILAARLGARRVYSLEPANIIQLARDIAVANGMSDRIDFIQEMSTQVELPERADVIVSDLRGILPYLDHAIPSIVDARERLLAPGGVLIPQVDTVWGVPVEGSLCYERNVAVWDAVDGIDCSAGHRMSASNTYKFQGSAAESLAEPVHLTTLDYRTVTDSRVRADGSWLIARDGTARGLCAWFDTELWEGIGFSNRLGGPEVLYGQLFFPFEYPLQLGAGQGLRIRLSADLVGGAYVWRWETWVEGQLRFRQSTFQGAPVPVAALKPLNF